MSEARTALADHFVDHAQQHAASSLGMWVFLITEVMFFGGLSLVYAVGRVSHPEAFARPVASWT